MAIAIWGLAIAAISLVASIGKIVFDIQVAPRREQSQSRRIRAEVRREAVASDLRRLLGLRGALLVSAVESAYNERDLESMREAVNEIAEVAQEAHRIAETINDAVEVHLGVIMVEAQELVAWLDQWLSTDSTTYDFEQFRDQIDLIVQQVSEVQNWCHRVLGDPAP